MQKHVNLVDLVKSFPTSIYLQNLASIQKRTSPVKFDRLAEKSEKDSISNLSTEVLVARVLGGRARPDLERWPDEDAAARHEVTPRDTAPMTKYISLLF